jgi:hypothetical protein
MPTDNRQQTTLNNRQPTTLLWGRQLRSSIPTGPDWLWQGYIAKGMTTLLTSQWKSGKTTLISVLLARMAEGGTLAGLPVNSGKAIVLSEESPDLWAQRAHRLDINDHVGWLCRPFTTLPDPAEYRRLIDQLLAIHRDRAIDLVVIDTLACFFPRASENLADNMLQALLPLQDLTARGAALLLLHHPKKGETRPGQAARGSGALPGFVDVLIEMSWYAAPQHADRRRRLQTFSRFSETPARLVIELNADATDYTSLGDIPEPDADQIPATIFSILAAAEADPPASDTEDHDLPSPSGRGAGGEEEAQSTAACNEGKVELPLALTRAQILDLWPPDVPRPDASHLGRRLQSLVASGAIHRTGTGRKNDPYRYALPVAGPGPTRDNGRRT